MLKELYGDGPSLSSGFLHQNVGGAPDLPFSKRKAPDARFKDGLKSFMTGVVIIKFRPCSPQSLQWLSGQIIRTRTRRVKSLILTWSPEFFLSFLVSEFSFFQITRPYNGLATSESVYSRISRYGHFSYTDSFQCPDKILIYFLLKKTSIIRTRSNTDNGL